LQRLVWLLDYQFTVHHSKVIHEGFEIVVKSIQYQVCWFIYLHLLSGTSTMNFFFELMLNAEMYNFFSYTDISIEYGSLSSSLSAIISTFFSSVLYLPIYDRNFLEFWGRSYDSSGAYSAHTHTLMELEGGAHLWITVLS
jgi:hypothetical protein